ncbi:hypothetical protein WJX72_012399 [[Myrmecia] bisecta]|uniref:Trafficking protein particle complex subunit 13 n=1 Tax=[Myrmecia] bisecta TaxID=41462 RepID=A0AAW1PVG3_9CHLO
MAQPAHALEFRVIRLCKPNLHTALPLRFNLTEDLTADYVDLGGGALPSADLLSSAAGSSFADRVQLSDAMDASGLDGYMEVPQSFGTIYLGETFCSYVSLGNCTDLGVTLVGIKAELQTERAKAVLFDNTTSPLPVMLPSGRHDFIIKHDVKEIGAHTLVCSTVYTAADGERKYLPRYFKFVANNPLSVRTKTRVVGDDIFMEACVDNATKGPLMLEYVRFDAAAAFTATPLDVREAMPAEDPSTNPWGAYINSVQMIAPNSGAANFLYHLRRAAAPGIRKIDVGSAALGKLEIKWRGPMGEVGRLQTQQIMGAPTARKEVELKLLSLPARIMLEQPFEAVLTVQSNVERRVGPLLLHLAPPLGADAQNAQKASDGNLLVQGVRSVVVDELAPFGEQQVRMVLLPVASGVQRITGVTLVDEREGKPYDSLLPTDLLVQSH